MASTMAERQADGRARALDAVLYGGGTVAVLDGLDAIIVTLLFGGSPVRMFQGIASGLFGRAAFSGGLPMAALGLAIHVFIAFAWTTIFVLAAQRLPVLVRRAPLAGVAFGLLVYCAMYFIVMPLSAIGFPRITPVGLANQLFAHTCLVGVPIALWTRRFLR